MKIPLLVLDLDQLSPSESSCIPNMPKSYNKTHSLYRIIAQIDKKNICLESKFSLFVLVILPVIHPFNSILYANVLRIIKAKHFSIFPNKEHTNL